MPTEAVMDIKGFSLVRCAGNFHVSEFMEKMGLWLCPYQDIHLKPHILSSQSVTIKGLKTHGLGIN